MLWFGLKKRVEELEAENKRIKERLGSFAYFFSGSPTVSQAIYSITGELGLQFEVEPAKGEQVKLVKVKK
jgi:hypothetical protein